MAYTSKHNAHGLITLAREVENISLQTTGITSRWDAHAAARLRFQAGEELLDRSFDASTRGSTHASRNLRDMAQREMQRAFYALVRPPVQETPLI